LTEVATTFLWTTVYKKSQRRYIVPIYPAAPLNRYSQDLIWGHIPGRNFQSSSISIAWAAPILWVVGFR